MGYTLQAVVAKSDILRIDGLKPIQLPQSYSLCSIDSDYCEKWSVPFLPVTYEDLSAPPEPIETIVLEISKLGPVAYLEAEMFSGDGTQACIVWDREKVVQPLFLNWRAINVALRILGVERGEFFDEFDAIDLGRHRQIDAWSDDS